MKLSAYKELESSKRSQALSRIILIAGAHVVIIGGAFLVTQLGNKQPRDPNGPSVAGVWSNQGTQAGEPTVDPSSDSLFDDRAGDLRGYNGDSGNLSGMLAANTSSASSTTRFTPRRPSDSDSEPSSTTGFETSTGDGVLQPVRQQSDDLFPDRSYGSTPSGLSPTIEYKVQNGDSLWGLSKRFKVSVAEIIGVNPGIKANAIRVGQTINIPRSDSSPAASATPVQAAATPSASRNASLGSTYKVKAGDSLSRIASRQGLTVAELKAANGLTNDTIRIGQDLIIPSARSSSESLVSQQHRGPKVTVKAGDTLDKIAAIHGVSSRELMRLNDITDPGLIRIGQVILIPEKATARTPSRTATATPTVTPTIRPEPARTVPAQTLEDLPTRPLVEEELPTLDDAFGAEDLEDQPLIPVQEQ